MYTVLQLGDISRGHMRSMIIILCISAVLTDDWESHNNYFISWRRFVFFRFETLKIINHPAAGKKSLILIIIITTTTTHRHKWYFIPEQYCARRWTCSDRLSGYLVDLRFALSIISYYNIKHTIWPWAPHTHSLSMSSSWSHHHRRSSRIFRKPIFYIR